MLGLSTRIGIKGPRRSAGSDPTVNADGLEKGARPASGRSDAAGRYPSGMPTDGMGDAMAEGLGDGPAMALRQVAGCVTCGILIGRERTRADGDGGVMHAHAPARRLSGRCCPPLAMVGARGRRRENVCPDAVRRDAGSFRYGKHLVWGNRAAVLPAMNRRGVLTDGPRQRAGRSEKLGEICRCDLHDRRYCRLQHWQSSPDVAFCAIDRPLRFARLPHG